jgi:xanthine/uracil permease
MDLTKRLVDWTEQPPEQWLNVVNKYLPPAVTAVLVLTIAYQLAGITWSLEARGATHGSQQAHELAPLRRGPS